MSLGAAKRASRPVSALAATPGVRGLPNRESPPSVVASALAPAASQRRQTILSIRIRNGFPFGYDETGRAALRWEGDVTLNLDWLGLKEAIKDRGGSAFACAVLVRLASRQDDIGRQAEALYLELTRELASKGGEIFDNLVHAHDGIALELRSRAPSEPESPAVPASVASAVKPALRSAAHSNRLKAATKAQLQNQARLLNNKLERLERVEKLLHKGTQLMLAGGVATCVIGGMLAGPFGVALGLGEFAVAGLTFGMGKYVGGAARSTEKELEQTLEKLNALAERDLPPENQDE